MGLAALVLLLATGAWAAPAADDESGIRAAVLDYLEGYFTSDPARMERALHPNLFKCHVVKIPGTDLEMVTVMTAAELIAVTGHNQAWVQDKEGFREMEIVYRDERIAVVHAVSSGFYDVIGLVRLNGEWKIIQVLWDLAPES